MDSFVQVQNDAYFWLGTSDTNRAFPRAQMKRVVNMAAAAIYEDVVQSFPDSMTVRTTLTADPTDTTSYILASQSPAITNAGKIVEVRLNTAEGSELTEVPFSERYVRPGLTYSVVGIGPSAVLYGGRSVAPGINLSFAYVPTYTALDADSDEPTWLPEGFGDVLSLAAVRLAVGSGNEQTMSPLLLDRLQDRLAQLWVACGQRSLSPTVARR